MRDLLEDGFEVCIAKDATAAAVLPGGDAYAGALLNFRMMASSVQTTEELVGQIGANCLSATVQHGVPPPVAQCYGRFCFSRLSAAVVFLLVNQMHQKIRRQ